MISFKEIRPEAFEVSDAGMGYINTDEFSDLGNGTAHLRRKRALCWSAKIVFAIGTGFASRLLGCVLCVYEQTHFAHSFQKTFVF